ncbi:2'-5' RNA ligase family protein [Actinomadura rugatobispora]|uniref:2'-5' RNA ligase family protein n=1 Tax=Actinomadura rugatobispora TaxID=1994 RepID=A0ABW1AH85_9ACTN
MSDHWWWRPGARPGRRLLVWHILLHDQPEPRELVRQCQDKLAGLDGLDLIPEEWLHMTTQIIGFADEISVAEVDAMLEGAAERLGALAPVEVELGKLWFHSEAIMLGVRPPQALDPVREALRDAVAASVRAPARRRARLGPARLRRLQPPGWPSETHHRRARAPIPGPPAGR